MALASSVLGSTARALFSLAVRSVRRDRDCSQQERVCAGRWWLTTRTHTKNSQARATASHGVPGHATRGFATSEVGVQTQAGGLGYLSRPRARDSGRALGVAGGARCLRDREALFSRRWALLLTRTRTQRR